jgi:hypothetical protein
MKVIKMWQLLAMILENFVDIILSEKSNLNLVSLLEKFDGKKTITYKARDKN